MVYPYYARYIFLGDDIGFASVNFNLKNAALFDTGTNMIQRYLALNDKSKDSCNIVLSGIYSQLEKWWQYMKNHRYDIDKHGFKFNPEVFTAKDKKGLDTKWILVPYGYGDFHITSALISQGASRPATKRHRIIFPCFVGVKDNLESLEIPESDNFE